MHRIEPEQEEAKDKEAVGTTAQLEDFDQSEGDHSYKDPWEEGAVDDRDS